ncbi:MAG: hypothetical protein NZS48_00965 [Gemmata sp.]|nr:hypothetical protein [Gemmata sp.]
MPLSIIFSSRKMGGEQPIEIAVHPRSGGSRGRLFVGGLAGGAPEGFERPGARNTTLATRDHNRRIIAAAIVIPIATRWLADATDAT